jgi:hypothetical protein
MNRLFVALALTAALSTPALAMPGARADDHRQVQPRSEQKQSQARESRTNDPYWQPCHYSSYMDNSCEEGFSPKGVGTGRRPMRLPISKDYHQISRDNL